MSFKKIGNRAYNITEIKRIGRKSFKEMMKGRYRNDLDELYNAITGETNEKPIQPETKAEKGKKAKPD